MKTIQYKKEIQAPATKVYRTMLGLDNIKTYEKWTAAFDPSSTYEGSWDKGSKIYFVGKDKEGNRGGMISEIVENIANEFISIRHYGILKGTQEITEGPEVASWAGNLENYSFKEHQGITTVTVDSEVPEEYLDNFNTTWSKALDKLKELSEA
ncbi:SRPBCC domain-containing protein [Leeuwenhoekiella sp. ZYFB001]|uniref:SRPBCC domain-containing protein n=1 Tax=Leeuwenhoekiella sp. ZYFB001 TaxID=2719912 RepID=UPI00143153DF|nr:SRPBCC domain-containing protein [Leeuwenhoekiella sp. ZYFB001]